MKNFLHILWICWKESVNTYKFCIKNKRVSREVAFTRLRTACHILDKGLNAIPFEKGHGKSIYIQAIKIRDEIYDYYKEDDAFKWACKIIEEYEIAQQGLKAKIYPEYINYNETERSLFFKMIKSRVSCRNFRQDKINETIIREIVSIAVDAPNGCCRQTVRYYITQNVKIINNVIADVAGITCFSQIPCMVCVTSFENAYDIIDRRLQYVDASLSMENFVLAARAYNINCTICNFFHATKEQILHFREEFKIRQEDNIVAIIAMGYSDCVPPKPTRMNIEQFLSIR